MSVLLCFKETAWQYQHYKISHFTIVFLSGQIGLKTACQPSPPPPILKYPHYSMWSLIIPFDTHDCYYALLLLPIAPNTVPNITGFPNMGVMVSPGCSITKEPV